MTNKFKTASNLLFSLGFILVVIMVVVIAIEHHTYYQHPLDNSAPFSVAYLLYGFIFGVPAVIILGLALFFKNKANK